MELDHAIGLLLDELNKEGILDDTVIIMYGYHDVYYHNINVKIYGIKTNSIIK